ncbi:4-aminobutyrate aminotransferase [Legionella hackeliae]|nr:aminotransferase class III-fold pyridoxal phosphate-dependent enzyme [Legionella hackeliae]STX49276.1 4-aminobutyrate aminotransferase [Legionella hackeliae]
MDRITIKTSIPGPKSKVLMEQRYKHVARGPFHTTPIFVEQAKGSFIKDVDGNVFLDFSSGIGVVNTGHCPDAIVNAIQTQAKKIPSYKF